MKNHRQLFLAALAAVLLVTLLPAPAQAQNSVYGTVTDESGELLAEVDIHLITLRGAPITRKGKTNARGEFRLALPPQKFDFRFRLEKAGYQTEEVEVEFGLLRTGENTVRHDFEMKTLAAAQKQNEILGDVFENVEGVSDQAWMAYNRGIKALNKGKMEDAEAAFQNAIEKDERVAPAYLGLAEVYFRAERDEDALAAADQVLELRSNVRRAHEIRYGALRALNRSEEAAEVRAVLRGTARAGEFAKHAYNEGAEAANTGNPELAIVRFEEALELDPELTQARSNLLNLYMNSEHYEKAAATAEAVLEENPLDAQAMRVRLEANRALGLDDGGAALEALAETDPEYDPEWLFGQGYQLFSQGSTEEAIDALEKALELAPEHPEAHYWLGRAYLEAGRRVDARPLLERFLDLSPEAPQADRARELLEEI